ncbi:MAG: zf-HC2 domain-containing protein [Armatimonadota bacterium]
MDRICDQIQPDLLDYSKGLLSRPESEQIKAHLQQCEECAEVLREEVEFASQLSAIPVEEPINDVWTLVRAQTKPGRISPLAWLSGLMKSGVRRAAVAVVTVALLLFIVMTLKPAPQQVAKQDLTPKSSVAVKWSDDPMGSQTDAMIEFIDNM